MCDAAVWVPFLGDDSRYFYVCGRLDVLRRKKCITVVEVLGLCGLAQELSGRLFD